MKRVNSIQWVSLAVILLLVSACSSLVAQAPAAGTLTMTDGYGRQVEISIPSERVVSLAPGNSEILFAIGAGDHLVGRDSYSDYPAEVLDIQDVGGPYSDINLEVIVSLEPDLVLGSELTPEEQVLAMEDLGLTVFVMPNPLDFDSLYNNFELLAQFTGNAQNAVDLIGGLQQRVTALEETMAGVEETPLVFYELDGTEPSAPWIPGKGTYIDTLIGMAGGVNMGGAYSDPWIQVSAEEILAQDPQIIVLGDHNFGVTVEEVSARPGWDGITAVQEGRVYPFDDNLVGRPGPRLVDGLEQLARIIHPELFQ